MAGLQKLAQKTKRVNIKLKTTKYRYKCIHIYYIEKQFKTNYN